MTASFFTAHAEGLSTAGVIAELDGVLARADLEFSLLLSAPDLLDQVLMPVAARFPAQRIFGCTTSGEITGRGYHENSMAVSYTHLTLPTSDLV